MTELTGSEHTPGSCKRTARLVSLFAAAMLTALVFSLPSRGVAADTETTQSGQPTVTIRQTGDLSVPIRDAESRRANRPDERTLLVFDIDNTLLRMPQALGNDAWFNYHAGLLSQGTDPDFRDMGGLLDAQALLFGISRMVATQDDISELVRDMSAARVDVFLLSARDPELFDVTKRELTRNRIEYNAPYVCVFYLCSGSGRYDDQQIRSALAAIGIVPQTATYRPIVIRDGIMMAAGQDKGSMLALLLGGIGDRHYDRVIFVDDSKHNIDAVAARSFPLPVEAYYYTRWNGDLGPAEIRKTNRQFRQLRSVACKAIAATFC